VEAPARHRDSPSESHHGNRNFLFPLIPAGMGGAPPLPFGPLGGYKSSPSGAATRQSAITATSPSPLRGGLHGSEGARSLPGLSIAVASGDAPCVCFFAYARILPNRPAPGAAYEAVWEAGLDERLADERLASRPQSPLSPSAPWSSASSSGRRASARNSLILVFAERSRRSDCWIKKDLNILAA